MTSEQKQAYIERMAREIGEHFDCIQLLAHDSDTDTYQTFEAGSGSLFARMYQAQRWVEEEPSLIEDEEEDE